MKRFARIPFSSITAWWSTICIDDARFADNPLVTSQQIRFYVGMPLITPDGFPLGSLCAMDSVPRELEPQQMMALNTLAKQVVKNMELRAAYGRVHQLAEQLMRLNAGKDRLFNLVAARAIRLLVPLARRVPASA